jgi:antitoxin MazE7
MAMTTIKVPTELRDRLAARAKKDHITLAAAIAKALDEAEERQFWDTVRDENALLTLEEREAYLHNGTLLDDLDDPEDKAISIRGGW